MAQKWQARTHNVQPSRQATVASVEKYSNRCIKAQDFEVLQGHSGIRDRQTRGNTTKYLKSRGVWVEWVSAGEYTHWLVKKKSNEYGLDSYEIQLKKYLCNCLYYSVDTCPHEIQYVHALSISKTELPNNYSDLKQCRPQRLSPQKKGTLLLINNFYKNKMALEAEPVSSSSTAKGKKLPKNPTDSQ